MEPGTIIDAQHLPPPPPPDQTEATPEHIKHSHRFLSLYLIVILIAAVAGSVYAWQHKSVSSLNKRVRGLNSQVVTLQSQVKTLSAPEPNATNNNSPLQYKDWKTYCDTINNGCFRYPKDWTVSGSSNSKTASASLGNPTTTIAAQYNDPVTTQALDQVFYIIDVKDLNKDSLGLKVVERVNGNTPDMVIVDSAYLATKHVAADNTLSFTDDARFTSKTTKASAQLTAKPSAAVISSFKTTDQATAWFKTDDAKACLQMLLSFYYQ